MKKAVIIGGSNGMGLAIAKQLEKDYYLEICDCVAPEDGMLAQNRYHYNYCDLLDFDDEVFTNLAADEDVKLLMITAGIGRIADFQYHHIAEIEKMLTIDTVSTLKIFRIFYERILDDKKDFYAGVMGSISGWMSSPSASVYAAAKAAVVRFVESVNIELEAYGSKNRILDVSPASFKGSRFYGGKNNLSAMQPLAKEIVTRLKERETLFIPQYDEIFKGVLERYYKDPHEYGLHSYHYKADSGRLDNHQRVKLGYLSGIFNQLDIKTVTLLRKAKQQCDYLVIGLYGNDNLDERKALISSCKYVDKVIDTDFDDIAMHKLYHYNRLFVDSNRKEKKLTESLQVFYNQNNIKIIIV